MRAVVPDYELAAPDTLAETLALLAEAKGEVRPLAGGTDVMVELAAGKLKHKRWVSIWQHDELRGIEVTDDQVAIGALTTYTDVREHAVLSAEFPMLGQAAAESGAWAIQNRGTVGGNIVNASPAADTPPALLAYDAQLRLVSAAGERVVPYAGFHTGYKQMERRPDELVAAVILPRRSWPALHRYRKVGTRKAQAISKVCLAAFGVVQAGKVEHIRIAFGSVAPIPLACSKVEALAGHPADDTLPDAVVAAVLEHVTPIDDVRSTAGYRVAVAKNLARDFAVDLAAGRTGFSPQTR